MDDYAPSMGAALACYTLFSLAPLLLIVIAVAGLIFGQEAIRGEIVAHLGDLIGHDSAAAVQGLLRSASEPKGAVLSSVEGAVLLVEGVTTVFAELQSALDRIWRVPAAEKSSGLWGLLRSRMLSFGLILGLGFMPRARNAWSDVWIGAVVTALMFEAGKYLIGLYLGRAGVSSRFGAAGSLVVLLVWVYYSAQIFLHGAEFTWVYARTHGSQSANRTTDFGAKVPESG